MTHPQLLEDLEWEVQNSEHRDDGIQRRCPYRCNRLLRTGKTCQMERGHHGRCTATTFYCDSCHEVRRGKPQDEELDDRDQVVALHCWLCVRLRGRKK